MEIKSTGNHSAHQSRSTADSTSNAKGSRPGSAPVGNDKVTVTGQANEMLRLETTLANLPDINNERVEAIKAALADGSYKIDIDSLVDNLLSAQNDLT